MIESVEDINNQIEAANTDYIRSRLLGILGAFCIGAGTGELTTGMSIGAVGILIGVGSIALDILGEAHYGKRLTQLTKLKSPEIRLEHQNN